MSKGLWLLSAALIASLVMNLALYEKYLEAQHLPAAEERVTKLSEELAEVKIEAQRLRSEVSYYRNLTQFYIQEAQRLGSQPSASASKDLKTKEGAITAVAVAARREAQTGRNRLVGSTLEISVQLLEGRGRVLVSTEPLTGADFQSAAKTAVLVAERLTGVNLNGYDVVFSVRSEAEVQAVDGPSAGAAMTVLLVSMLENKELRRDVSMTGSIIQDGRIGSVGGVSEKAEAAGKVGAKVFLVPSGQSQQVTYVEKTYVRGSITFIITEPQTVDLNETMMQRYGMQVVEVQKISDAVKFFLK